MVRKDDPTTPEPEQPGDVRGDNDAAFCSHPSLRTSRWFGTPKMFDE